MRRIANMPRARAWLCRAGLLVVVVAAGCGGGPSGRGVASLGTTTTTAPASTSSGSTTAAGPVDTALAFSECMRTHGEPGFPEPSFHGHSANITIHPGSGVDPGSPQFAAAYKRCKHLLPNDGTPTQAQTISPADQADYLRAAACMRSHGVPDFPDPTFQDGTVAFETRTPIDTSSTQYRSALATCQKLIPAGLPYSSTSGP
jgi:hypothetical protein